LKENNDVHDVPCCKCLTKVVLTLSSFFSILPTKVAIFEGQCKRCAKYNNPSVHIQVCAKSTILMFATKYFSFSKSNAHCSVTWGELYCNNHVQAANA